MAQTIPTFPSIPGVNQSTQVLSYLQGQFGSTDFSSWQSVPWKFWSYVPYVAAGASVLTFFGDAIGTNSKNQQLTNMKKPGVMSNAHLLVKSISFDFFMPSMKFNPATLADDRDTFYSDVVNGFLTAGVAVFSIQDTKFLTLPHPFLYAPPSDGRGQVYNAGVRSLAAAGVGSVVTALTTPPPYADLSARRDVLWVEDPQFLLVAEQNFSCQLRYDSGLVPVIASNVENDTTNILYVGCNIEGMLYRPIQ